MYREELSDEGSMSSGGSYEVDANLRRPFKSASTGALIDLSTGNEADSSTMTEYLQLRSSIDKQLVRLSQETREIVQHTFKEMAKDSVRNGLFIFTSLFARHPRYINIWPDFRTMPFTFLMSSPYFQRHTTVYMSALRTIIDSLDNDTQLASILRRIAKAHIKHSIHKFHLMDMVETVRDVAWSCNKREFTRAEVDAAWNLLYDVIANFIDIYRVEALKVSNAEPNSTSNS